MPKIYSRIIDAGETLKTVGEVAVNKAKSWKNKRDIISNYQNRLPVYTSKETRKEINRLGRENNFKGVRDYTRSQLIKMKEQVKDHPGSAEYIQNEINKINQ